MLFSNNIPLRVNCIAYKMLRHIWPRICNFVVKNTRCSPTFFSRPPSIINLFMSSLPGCMNALVQMIQVRAVHRISFDGPVPSGPPTSWPEFNSPTCPSLLHHFHVWLRIVVTENIFYSSGGKSRTKKLVNNFYNEFAGNFLVNEFVMWSWIPHLLFSFAKKVKAKHSRVLRNSSQSLMFWLELLGAAKIWNVIDLDVFQS